MGNLLLYLCIVVLSSDVCYDVYASEDVISNKQVFLRRLRRVVESDPDAGARPSTVWNDVVAKEMVAKVIPFPRKKDPDESPRDENKSVILKELTSCLSGILLWYKNNVYDVFFGRNASGAPPESETETGGDPKEEVEIIEPRYHGRVCEEEGCNGATPAACPEGETRNSEGVCVNSRMILRLPSRCPIGYVMDRSGYCRQLW